MKENGENGKNTAGGERPSPDFQRRGRDIVVAMRTNPFQAPLGATYAAPTGLDSIMDPFLQRCRIYGAAKPAAALDAESAEVLGNIKALL